jgi:2-hydroxy-6-oxonona-2,4-dienedioate hydrolase
MYVKVGGLRIRYNEYGINNSRHVLFIHGLGSSSATWGDIPETLSEYFHSIVVDLIGFGKSDKPKADYTVNYYSQFIRNFLEQIGIKDQDRITIIGHSLGGYIALDYAIGNKEKIDKLVLIDSSGMLNHPTPLLEQYLDAALETDYFSRYRKVTRVFEDLLAEPSRYIPSKTIAFIGTMDEPYAKHAFESAYRNSTTISRDLERLKQIKDIPCLIIWGKDDELIPSSHIDRFKSVLKESQVEVIDNAGHSPHVEKPSKVYDKIKTFLTN